MSSIHTIQKDSILYKEKDQDLTLSAESSFVDRGQQNKMLIEKEIDTTKASIKKSFNRYINYLMIKSKSK